MNTYEFYDVREMDTLIFIGATIADNLEQAEIKFSKDYDLVAENGEYI